MRWLILFAIIAVVIWAIMRKRGDKKPRALQRIRHGRGGAEGGADTDFGDGGSDSGGDGGGGGD